MHHHHVTIFLAEQRRAELQRDAACQRLGRRVRRRSGPRLATRWWRRSVAAPVPVAAGEA